MTKIYTMKYLFTFPLIIASFLLCGQGAGDLLVGGGINIGAYQSSSEEQVFFTTDPPIIVLPGGTPAVQSRIDQVDRSSFSVSFSPYVGKVLSEKVTAGVGLSAFYVGSKTTRNDFETNDNGSRFGGYAWMRYTLNPANKLRFYVEPRLGYDAGRGRGSAYYLFSNTVFLGSGSSWNAELGAPIGLTYSLGERFLANLRVGSFSLVRGKWTSDIGQESQSYTDFGLRLNARTVSLGFEFVL